MYRNNIIVGVCSTKKYKNTRIKALKETWLKDVNHVIFSDEDDPANNIVKVSDDETYESNVEKCINGLKWFHENIDDIDWIITTDDNEFLNIFLLKEFIKTLNENCVYGNILTCNTDPTNSIWNIHGKDFKFPSGICIIYSKKVLNLMYDKVENICHYGSDVNLGLCYRKYNIPLVHTDLIVLTSPKNIWSGDELNIMVKRHLAFHKLEPDDQRWLYNIILDTKDQQVCL